MNDAPTTVCRFFRTEHGMTYGGRPLVSWMCCTQTGGHRVRIVVVGVTPHQGDGNTVRRAKSDREMMLCETTVRIARCVR
jgi:hypothetical protein